MKRLPAAHVKEQMGPGAVKAEHRAAPNADSRCGAQNHAAAGNDFCIARFTEKTSLQPDKRRNASGESGSQGPGQRGESAASGSGGDTEIDRGPSGESSSSVPDSRPFAAIGFVNAAGSETGIYIPRRAESLPADCSCADAEPADSRMVRRQVAAMP
jgi:hypothetical protein